MTGVDCGAGDIQNWVIVGERDCCTQAQWNIIGGSHVCLGRLLQIFAAWRYGARKEQGNLGAFKVVQ